MWIPSHCIKMCHINGRYVAESAHPQNWTTKNIKMFERYWKLLGITKNIYTIRYELDWQFSQLGHSPIPVTLCTSYIETWANKYHTDFDVSDPSDDDYLMI